MNKSPITALLAFIPLAVALAVTASQVQAGNLVHKVAGLQLWTPDDWTAEEEDSVLTLTAPSEELAISLTLLEATEIDEALAGLNESLTNDIDNFEAAGDFEQIDLGGLAALTLAATGEIDGEPVKLELALVATPTGKVMMVLLIAQTSAFEGHRAVIEQIFASLRPADQPERAGVLVVRYEPGNDAMSRAIAGEMGGEGVFKDVVTDLSQLIVLPRDIPVAVGYCGQANAFYDPETGQIAICYELLQWFSQLFASDGDLSEQETAQHVANAAVFTLLHELGHGLIDILDIPATGKEEDAVDDLAALLLLHLGREQAALSAVGQFALATLNIDEEDELAFWDEHSLDPQRMFNLVCLIVGSDPERNGALFDDVLPPERANRCPAEYEQKSRSWGRLLGEHLRP